MRMWSTHGLPKGSQLGFWREVICKAFAALDPVPLAQEATFPGEVELGRLGPVDVARVASCAQFVHRRPAQIRVDPQDRLFVNLQVAGEGRVTQDDRWAHSIPGTFTVVDTARPYRLEFDENFEVLSFRVPRTLLLPLVQTPGELVARPIGSDSTIGRLAVGYMRLLAQSDQTMAGDEQDAVASHLCQLIASATRMTDPARNDPSVTMKRRFVAAALKHLDANLADPVFGAATLAKQFGVSVRYVQQAFADAGTTVGTELRTRRLHRIASALADQHERAAISSIAMRWGFSDMPHFTRLFGKHYGRSPRRYRLERRGR